MAVGMCCRRHGAHAHRYSSAQLASYQSMTQQTIRPALRVCMLIMLPGFMALPLWLRGHSMSFGSVLLTPRIAGFVVLGSLLLVAGVLFLFGRRNRRRIQPQPPRSDDVSLRERWPLIEWWMLNGLGSLGLRSIPTSGWPRRRVEVSALAPLARPFDLALARRSLDLFATAASTMGRLQAARMAAAIGQRGCRVSCRPDVMYCF
jgi:hypothetical protein